MSLPAKDAGVIRNRSLNAMLLIPVCSTADGARGLVVELSATGIIIDNLAAADGLLKLRQCWETGWITANTIIST
jgi:hypothetical protein